MIYTWAYTPAGGSKTVLDVNSNLTMHAAGAATSGDKADLTVTVTTPAGYVFTAADQVVY